MPTSKVKTSVPSETTAEDLFSRPRRGRTLTFCSNEELVAELDATKTAKSNPYVEGDERKTAQIAYEEARAAMLADPSTRQIRLEGMERGSYQELIEQHPATEEQQAKARERNPDARLAWNEETFVPALIATCMVSPKLTIAQADRLLEVWGAGDVNDLVTAAHELCQSSSQVDLGN